MQTNNVKIPRIMISAIKSGSGKTLITCGLIKALMNRGLKVGAKKSGPDYIDPMFHRRVLGIKSGNIDSFFTDEALLRHILVNDCHTADITVIEGVMGFYDGVGGTSVKGSSYELSNITKTPVILVVDARGASVTLSALIQGVISYKKDNHICGIILNKVSESFYERIRDVIEDECNIPVLGYVPKLKNVNLDSRHLGLVSPDEIKGLDSMLEQVAWAIEHNVDLDRLIKIADEAEELHNEQPACLSALFSSDRALRVKKCRPVIAIARDEAFSFYYDENIALLEELGAVIKYFSPLRDEKLPENTAGIILYGGYPELYAKKLGDNKKMLQAIRRAYDEKIPIIAECGGFLYLQKELEASDGNSYEMANVLAGKGLKNDRLKRFGYFEGILQTDGLYGKRGSSLKYHEFHYWDTTDNGSDMISKKPLMDTELESLHHGNRFSAGFMHFYAYSNPECYLNFLWEAAYVYSELISRKKWDSIAKPLHSFGVFETQISKIAGIKRDSSPGISKKALLQFCADHGVVEEKVTQTSQEITKIVTQNFAKGISCVNWMAKTNNTDVYTVDVGINAKLDSTKKIDTGCIIDRKIKYGTDNLYKISAMSQAEAEQAILVGKELVRELNNRGYDLICLGEMGIGNTTPTSILIGAILGLAAKDVTGKGAGLSQNDMLTKKKVIASVLDDIRKNNISEPVELLERAGGLEIAAMVGAILEAHDLGIPIVLDGCITNSAALVAKMMDESAIDACIATHKSNEKSAIMALEALHLEAPIQADMCLGEGSGAVLWFSMLDTVMPVYLSMSSFEDNGIEPYSDFEKDMKQS